jgi:hypothetical protein
MPSWPEQPVEAAWARAVAINTRRAYQEFLVVHPLSGQAAEARRALARLWAGTVLATPDCRLTSNLSVELSWSSIEGADGYEVQWSQRKDFPATATASERVTSTDLIHRTRRGAYGAKLPMYYRVVAIGGGGASPPSEPCRVKLLPSEGGKRCQICGAPSIGYCHLRAIHVCAGHNIFRDDRGTNWRCP